MKRLFVNATGALLLGCAMMLSGCIHNYGSASRPYSSSSTTVHRSYSSGSHRHHHHNGGRSEHHDHHRRHDRDHSSGSGRH